MRQSSLLPTRLASLLSPTTRLGPGAAEGAPEAADGHTSLKIARADKNYSFHAIAGSPFPGRVIFVIGGSGQRFENVPEIAKAQRAEIFIPDDPAAAIAIGDLATFPDGSFRKIIQVRSYGWSLQCGLQRQPFGPLACWTPQTAAQRTNAQTLKVSDLAFDAAPAVLGYMEPAPDAIKFTALGKLDTRACFAYTLAPLALGTVLQDARGEYWVAELPSDIWPLPGDCKTLMRHLITPPAGITK